MEKTKTTKPDANDKVYLREEAARVCYPDSAAWIAFCRHAVVTSSQYDGTCRALAAVALLERYEYESTNGAMRERVESITREQGEARADVRRALRVANELTLETQTCEEAVTDLVRLVREARARADENEAKAREHDAIKAREAHRVRALSEALIDAATLLPPERVRLMREATSRLFAEAVDARANAYVDPCPSVSESGIRCARPVGHPELHSGSPLGRVVWSDEPIKVRMLAGPIVQSAPPPPALRGEVWPPRDDEPRPGGGSRYTHPVGPPPAMGPIVHAVPPTPPTHLERAVRGPLLGHSNDAPEEHGATTPQQVRALAGVPEDPDACQNACQCPPCKAGRCLECLIEGVERAIDEVVVLPPRGALARRARLQLGARWRDLRAWLCGGVVSQDAEDHPRELVMRVRAGSWPPRPVDAERVDVAARYGRSKKRSKKARAVPPPRPKRAKPRTKKAKTKRAR